MTQDPRFPIGRFRPDPEVTPQKRAAWIEEIRVLPKRVRSAVQGLDDEQLDTPYRDGGWTVRQVAHHLPDSHINAYVRFKLGLTEDNPTIRPYDEAVWAELPDGRAGSIDPSLTVLDGLHRRWVLLLDALREADFDRTVFHPEHQRTLTLDVLLQMYAWHGRHHVAHVTELRDRMGW